MTTMILLRRVAWIGLSALLTVAAPAFADPTAHEILAKYDEVMSPKTFEAEGEMTAHREDGSARTYVMKFLRGEGDRFRIWFTGPSSVAGQEMLREGDNLWVYLPRSVSVNRC